MKTFFVLISVSLLLFPAVCGRAEHIPTDTQDLPTFPIEIRAERATVSPGDTFSVDVTLIPAICLRRVDIKISYDPDLLLGIAVSQCGPGNEVVKVKGAVNSKKGTLLFTASSDKKEFISHSNGTLCAFTFVAIKPGQANLVWRCFGAILDKRIGPGVPFQLKAASVVISEKKEAGTDLPLPDCFALSQNYPNPFNPETRLSYQLPEPRHVRLTVFNILGQEVRTLVSADQAAGFYTIIWDGKDNRGYDLSSGTYFCRMKAGEFTKVQRMILLR